MRATTTNPNLITGNNVGSLWAVVIDAPVHMQRYVEEREAWLAGVAQRQQSN